MTNNALLTITGLFFLFFTVFSLWFLRREYRLRKKLTWAGSIVHVAMFAVHGMFCSLLVWGPETMPAMGAGAGLGIALMLVGLGVTIYAMDLFRRFSRWLGSDTPGLTTNGLYRFSRNPQFVGYGLFILGFYIVWWGALALIGIFSYVALAYAVARMEEEHLTLVYGQSYLDYGKQVPRFFGWPYKMKS